MVEEDVGLMYGTAVRSSTIWTLFLDRYAASARTTPSRASTSLARYGKSVMSEVVPSVMAIA